MPLVRTNNQGELAFQQAEVAREKAVDEASRKAAADLYRKAIELKQSNAQAHVGLARVLLELNDYSGALAEIQEARRYRPGYAEASAVELNDRFAKATVFSRKRTRASHLFTRNKETTMRQRRNFVPPSSNFPILSRLFTNSSARLTKSRKNTKKPSPLTKSTCSSRQTATSRPQSDR
jgi:tetratricopeptide (TPR) repeat protein